MLLPAYWIVSQNLTSQLEQQTKLADFYREQVLELEEQIAKLREEGDITKDALKVQYNDLFLSVLYYLRELQYFEHSTAHTSTFHEWIDVFIHSIQVLVF